MMHESELADPYMTPRAIPVRRPYKYLVVGGILAIVLLTLAAASLMVWLSIGRSPFMLDRSPPIDRVTPFVEATRGPVRDRYKQSANSPEPVAPQMPAPQTDTP